MEKYNQAEKELLQERAQDIEQLIQTIVGNNFLEDDREAIISYITTVIWKYNNNAEKKILRTAISLVIDENYKMCYAKEINKFEPEKLDIEKTKKKVIICGNYINPETNKYIGGSDDSIQSGIDTINKLIMTCDKLVCHIFDYDKRKFSDDLYKQRSITVRNLKAIPQFEQKSSEWYDQRNGCLTATAVATALDEDPYKYPAELLLEKCGKGEPFIENENVHHGRKYEQVGNMFYEFRNNVSVGEYGLIQHSKNKFIGASPDGICERYSYDRSTLTKLVGRLLEIKFPKRRKILTDGELDGDICPHYYFVQVQTQLYVTGLDECDFLQCKIEEYSSWEDYKADTHPLIPSLSNATGLEKGCLIQLLPINMIGKGDHKMCIYNSKYIYPPKLHMTETEIKSWISEEMINFPANNLSAQYMIDRVIYWRLATVACNLIKADNEWMRSKVPQLKQFWNYVLFYRKNPEKLEEIHQYIKLTGVKKSDEIFYRVHADYASSNPNTIYEPLYQKDSEWRKKYKKKYQYVKK